MDRSNFRWYINMVNTAGLNLINSLLHNWTLKYAALKILVDQLQNQNQIFITTSNKTKTNIEYELMKVRVAVYPYWMTLELKVRSHAREPGWDTMGTISITWYTLTSGRHMVLVGTETTLRCYGLGFECLSLFYFWTHS